MRILRSTLFWAFLGLVLVGAMVWQYRSQFGATWIGKSAATTGQMDSSWNPSLSKDRIVAEGRVATYHGAQITLSAEIPGVVEKLTVDEKDTVAKGDVIAEIKVEDLRAALVEAKARLAEIDAEIRLASIDLKRDEKLRAQGAVSQQEFDKAQRDFDLVTAQRGTAEATIQKIKATVVKAIIHSPIAGVVITRFAHPGEMADVGTKLVTIADTNRIRIEAEIDEFDAGKVFLGQAVTITAEGYPDKTWQGKVEEIPDAVTERNLKPLDPSRPTEARVLRVKIAFKELTPLKLGQRVEVEMARP
jgi:RND family efflux transporter MFP subunit